MDASVRTAVVIGLGGQAVGDHLPGLAGSRHARLVAVLDTDPGRAAAVGAEFRVPGYTDLAELLQREKPDFAIVAVPHHAGRAVVEACARAGVHVMKEKPFATSPVEAAELAELCTQYGVELMVTVQRRFHPVYAAVPQMLEHIGPAYLVEGRYTFHTPDPGAGWRGNASLAGGGALADMGYHLLDLVLWYLGLPDRVTATLSATAGPGQYDAEDTAVVHLDYDGGPSGTLLISRSAGPKTEQLVITGPGGRVVIERGTARRLTPAGQVVDQFVRDPAWPDAAATQIDTFCRVLNGTQPNPSGPADHQAHAAFLAAAYASAVNCLPCHPKEYLR